MDSMNPDDIEIGQEYLTANGRIRVTSRRTDVPNTDFFDGYAPYNRRARLCIHAQDFIRLAPQETK